MKIVDVPPPDRSNGLPPVPPWPSSLIRSDTMTPCKTTWPVACLTIFLLADTAIGAAEKSQNLLVNSDFEQTSSTNRGAPAYWTDAASPDTVGLELTDDAYSQNRAVKLVADNKHHMWRQDVIAPRDRAWTLSGWVKAKGATLGKDDYARLYCHVIYKNQPYSTATHFSVDIPPGTYDWKKFSVHGMAGRDQDTIEKLHISVTGKLGGGALYVDSVELHHEPKYTTEGLLVGKIDDLAAQLKRVGNVDATVRRAQQQLSLASAALGKSPPDGTAATEHWIAAAKALSHQAWAAMYPETLSDKDVEAQMIYHAMAQTPEGCNHYLDKLELAGANGVYLSFGSWMQVNFHSNILPITPGWEKFDSLAYIIAEAHRRGIKVFGYYAPFYGTSSPVKRPGSILVEHPEWFAHGPDSRIPLFPDPANPEVVDYVVSVYEDLATRYDLDGIGLDYIRYPTPQSLNYDERNRRQIKKRYGIDILQHENVYGDPEAWKQVQKYRAEMVGRVVKRVSSAIRQARPGISIMACLISERAMGRDEYGQDWAKSSQWIDYASPMNYEDFPFQTAIIEEQKKVFDQTGSVYIPAVGGMPQIHRAWTISDWAKRVAIYRELDSDGIIIYRNTALDPAVAAFFGKGPFYRDARFPDPPRR